MLNFFLSPMTRLDWLIVLLIVIGLTWLSTTRVGIRLISKWTMKKTKEMLENFDEMFPLDDD